MTVVASPRLRRSPCRVARTSSTPVAASVRTPGVDRATVRSLLARATWPPGITEGEQMAVTPAGLEGASRVTAPWKPFCDWRLTLDIALPPAMKERLQGEADREKSGGDPTKNSDMFRAPESFAFKVGRFQFASTVARCEKWL